MYFAIVVIIAVREFDTVQTYHTRPIINSLVPER